MQYCYAVQNYLWPANRIESATKPEQAVVYQGYYMKVVVPPAPLAAGSLRIESSIKNIDQLSDWKYFQHTETFELITKIVKIWKDANFAESYMVFGKVSADETTFAWEIVPYPKTKWVIVKVWNQFKVLWNITFGGKTLDASAKNRVTDFYARHEKTFSDIPPSEPDLPDQSDCYFCKSSKKSVIDAQLVHQGMNIRILHDHAPLLGKDKPHLLLMPNKHRPRFEDLRNEEYLEISQDRSALLHLYEKKGYRTFYIFNKSGKEAGQSVGHLHEHFVPTASKINEFFGKLTVLKKMMLPFLSSKMKKEELEERVKITKIDLKEDGWMCCRNFFSNSKN